jgi:hypothetical protein
MTVHRFVFSAGRAMFASSVRSRALPTIERIATIAQAFSALTVIVLARLGGER